MYPPRFTLGICSGNATEDSSLQVEFEGATKNITVNLPLAASKEGEYTFLKVSVY